MDKNQQKLLNLYTDLRRAILEMTSGSHDAYFQNNIIKNYPELIKIDPNIKKFIDIKIIQEKTLPQKLQAEHFLMFSQKLANYLFR